MKKYILDTSAIVNDPLFFKSYENCELILPIAVLDELDKLKKQFGEAGKNARVAIRLLDEISDKGDISVGVLLENGVTLTVDIQDHPKMGDSLYGDTHIIACANHYNKEFPEDDVTLVSNDINLRIRAKALSIVAESYQKDRTDVSELFSGLKKIVDPEAAADLLQDGIIDPAGYNLKLDPNECVLFLDDDGTELALGRKTNSNTLRLVKPMYPWSLSPRNKEQTLAIDMISDARIPLITLIGKAGCGKTLIALAASLELVLNKKQYDKFIIYRPIQPMGNDLGYMPGEMSEKLAPWFSAINDNFEVLFSASHGDKWRTSFEAVKKKDRIQMEALTYIRGRSIPNAIMLIDESQNISKEEMKTILTRVGEGTKIILTGDIEQIDNKDLDPMNNGLSYIIEKFKDSPLAGHITFTQGERSALATKAAAIL